jgi:two-component system chemotaxis response regulator CheB
LPPLQRGVGLEIPYSVSTGGTAPGRAKLVPMNHDIIVIGGSAGAIDVLLQTVSRLPAKLPAAVFVVVHLFPGGPSVLPQLLGARGPLPARHPLHDDPIVPGHVYVAPPDNHLMLSHGSMRVVRGPRENGHRPAVDTLFRSAAIAYGPRVIGVVLSGYQDCGTAGMMSIKARGGISVVQSPSSARAADMPRSVIENVQVDHVVEPAGLADLLARLCAEPVGDAMEPDEFINQLEGAEPGAPVELVCPSCQGVLQEARRGSFVRFRCHTGHAFSLESLVREQSEELERALYAAARALEESSALSVRVSKSQSGDMQERFAEKATSQQRDAQVIRQILQHGSRLSRSDADEM